MTPSQANRTIAINTVLGPDVLLFASMSATEHLSQPFEYELALLSERIDLRADDLLGTRATVSLRLPPLSPGHPGDRRRFFDGFISRFSHVGLAGALGSYRATLVPWLWFLSRRTDCRIYQDNTVPEIVTSIFRDHGFTDFTARLTGTYRPWGYCVQYRETDLNFVQRLLEHEGIYYFHEHTDGKHTLVLADDDSAHSPTPGYQDVVYFPPGATALHDLERIEDWSLVKAVRPGAFAHNSFDFTAPRKGLLTRLSAPKDHALARAEVFDYQGDYTESVVGETYARIRLEEHQADHEIAHAAGNARGLTSGGIFTLKDHPRADQNHQYLIIAASYRLAADRYGSGEGAAAGPEFHCNLLVMDAKVQYRPPRVTPKPIVQGPQTAMVVGKAGEEIWTDKYGRVKVKFHWDRYAKGDETSSCWVRVSHPWAGKGWGAVAIPRIGQEVIVDFLEGDPDQPIITGRVYNGGALPPFGLPAGAVVSGIKSNTHKGSGYNELSMDDTVGKEQITIHAQYDMKTTVEHDQTATINNNRTTKVVVDDGLTVDANRTVHVLGKLSETVDSGQETTITAGYTETVTGERTTTVTGPIKESATATIDRHADGAGTYTSNTSLRLAVAGSDVVITPKDITITAGGATIKLDATGVAINGVKISLNG